MVRNSWKGQLRVECRAGAAADEAAVLYLYGQIGSDGITDYAFASALDSLDGRPVVLRINSPGGDVFTARAMVDAMRRYSGEVLAEINGWCLSAATHLAVAADRSVISPGSFFMIHNAWTVAIGDRAELAKVSALLSQVDDVLAKEYGRKAKVDIAQIRAWMDEETWFTAEEAVHHGFVDALVAIEDASVAASWDLSVYRNAPAVGESLEADLAAVREKMERRLRLLEL